jgi:hypothetical protein
MAKKVETDPANVKMVEEAFDKRLRMAGAGDEAGVQAAKLKQVASDMRLKAKPISQGGKLRARQLGKGAAYSSPLWAPPLIATGATDDDFLLKSYRDTHDLIVGFVPSSIQFVTATGDALLAGVTGQFIGEKPILGSSSRFEEMWKQLKDTSPVALALQGEWDKAWDAFEERPISGAIELGGVYAVAGRTAGIAGRRLGFESAKTGGRAPIHLTGNLSVERSFSANYFTKMLQLAGEKVEKKYLDPKDAPDFGGKTREKWAQHTANRRRVEFEKAMDAIFAQMYIGQRSMRAITERQLADIGKKAHKEDKHGPYALWAVATKIARKPSTAIADIKSYRDNIQRQLDEIGPGHGSYEIYHRNLDVLDRILDNPQVLQNQKLWDIADEYKDFENKHQDELVGVGALQKEQTDFARWIPYATWHMGARFEEGKGFVLNGKKLELKDIKDHAEINGVSEPAMITSRYLDGAHSSRYNALNVPNPYNQQSHGNAILAGTADVSFDSFIRQSVLSRSILDKSRMYRDLLDVVAVRPSGSREALKFASREAADEFINKHLKGVFGDDFTAVNYSTFRKEMKDVDAAFLTREAGTKGKNAFREMDDILTDALKKNYKEGNELVLVPSSMIKRLQQHAQIEHETGGVIRAINREFKGSVLAFSPKWHFGNIADMTSRLFFEGAGPSSYALGRKIMKEVEKRSPELHTDLLTLIGGGHLASADHSLLDFTHANPAIKESYRAAQMRSLQTVFRLGSGGYSNAIARMYRGTQRGSFFIGQNIEKHMRYAALGKAAKRQVRDMDRNMFDAIKLQPKLIEELVLGLEETPTQLKYARHVNKVMGDYTTMSPTFRKAVLTAMPFGLWLRASTKWALSLPYNSPIRTAMITSVNRLNEDERRALGLSAFKGDKKLPFFMLGAIPSGAPGTEGAKYLYRTNTYTSFGPLIEMNIASFILPQVSSILNALNGLDWTGEKLRNRNGDEITGSQRYGIALQQALETYMIPLAIAHQGIAQGDPDPTFTMFSLKNINDPGHLWSGLKKRDFDLGPDPEAGKIFESDYVATEDESEGVMGALGQALLPVHKTENFFVTGRRQQEAAAEEESKLKSADPEAEWLYGHKTSTTRQQDKRVTKIKKQEADWLYGSK